MVAKGVLKEHLILLANSMTCAGNLVGFNTGGYKALSRSLDIQVPFTEATLFTPRRVFERAAEKCHTDSLSSIVASCSWGKRVAVGTGSCFDILWDTNDANRSSMDRLRQEIFKLELEHKRLEEDAFVYNWLQQQLKLSPAYKQMLEIAANMEVKGSPRKELIERKEIEFTNISFEELLAQEKKDGFWQKNGKPRTFTG